MREALAEAMITGAFLLSPHAAEQPAAAEPVPHVEILADYGNLPAAQSAQPENLELTPVDSDPVKDASQYNVAIGGLDPETLVLWLEVGGGSLGLTGVGGFVRHRLKKSLRRH